MYIVKQRKLKAVFILNTAHKRQGLSLTGHTKDIEYRKTVYTKDSLYCYIYTDACSLP